jgi:uncharacterized protein
MTVRIILVSSMMLGLIFGEALAQKRSNSPVYRDYQSPIIATRPNRASVQEQWNDFMLVRHANSGEADAQHELALRYLFGRGFPVDTAKCIHWMQEAVAQNLPEAHYNYGLFLYNGWGIEWNPFEAYLHFKYAAEHEVPEGEYMMGALHTDNLVVNRDWILAYQWLNKAAKADFDPAKRARAELLRRGLVKAADTIDVKEPSTARKEAEEKSTIKGNWSPVFLDMNRPAGIDIDTVDYAVLCNEYILSKNTTAKDSLRFITSRPDALLADTSILNELRASVRICNPEAAALAGYCYQHATGRKNILAAALYYIHAMYYDSPRAMLLLFRLIRDPQHMKYLEQETAKKNTIAQSVLVSLFGLELYGGLTMNDARSLLLKAAEKGDVDAMIELGVWYSTGKFGHEDERKALEYWNAAAQLGNVEARLRIITSKIFRNEEGALSGDAVRELENAADGGSMMAEVALARCYELGLGFAANKSEAAKMYRQNAQRGSRFAYRALRHMYDERRPENEEFQVKEE